MEVLPTTLPTEPLLKVRLPLPHRLNCFLRLWALKCLAALYFFYLRVFKPAPAWTRPTLVRRYPCRPMLTTRVFFPPDYAPGKLLPVYLNIHGGGFAVSDAAVDDRFCVAWAKRTGMLVVSLDYRKVPRFPFPTATEDVAAQVAAVLEDPELPVDRTRVGIGGFSAGGHLALSAAQLPPLKGVVRAVVSYYPIVDFSHPPDVKMESRPYRDGPVDRLGEAGWYLDWGFVEVGRNRRDPVLSPCYAKAEDLPPRIYMVAAQWDMLRLEAQQMIHRLAGLEDKQDQEEAFEEGPYKWTLATGCAHGFTHGPAGGELKSARRKQLCEEIYQGAHEWLKKAGLA
ncbi:alpha/beta-hydrolase [Aspergillus ellipticus CBS 707.79]|uniref:Alpha/beta-hydrolase n=1 Tax=Aspergillus ellipticus CBS 707.79 TaxID=1448320 RepID=A0A319CY10_9EURO|nr:alpha/beta-hydrolase [Aspergillus ellipticus CBS 707.79]